MKRVLAVLLVLGCLTVVGHRLAEAITWGEVDTADRYPFVSLVLTQVSDTEFELCSGTLLSPTLVVTAAHCVADGIAGVSVVAFGISPLTAPTAVSFGVPVPHPDFVDPLIGPDVAVIPLLLPVPMASYGELPDPGTLVEVARMRGALSERFFRTVGFGIDGVSGYVSEGKPGLQVSGLRRVGEQSLVNIEGPVNGEALYAQFSGAAGTLSGGACLGDSGGPVFIGDSNAIAAVNSFGSNQNCAGQTHASRLDVETVLDLLAVYLP